jgi:hypothetical protein
MVTINRERIKKIEKLEDFDNEYVYDITMKDSNIPYFFANDILVHNSAYFVTGGNDIEEAVLIADECGAALNDSFLSFMKEAFLCQPGYDDIIKAGREIVAERALFQARKKYIAKVVDLEGFRVNKIKAMGSEIKKSDTPKVIQKFLKNVVDRILDGMSYNDVCTYVNEQRTELFKEISHSELILLGVTKSANNLEHFAKAVQAELDGRPFKAASGKGKLTIPGHVKAAIYYNRINEERKDTSSQPIGNGDKVRIFEVLPNEYNIKAIGIPAEATKFPPWFFEIFEIDLKLSEEKLICNKLDGIFSSMGLDVPTPQLNFKIYKLLKA